MEYNNDISTHIFDRKQHNLSNYITFKSALELYLKKYKIPYSRIGDKLLAKYYKSIIEESLETRAYRLPLTFLHYAAIFFRFLHFSLPPFTLDMFKRTYYYSDSISVPRVLQFLCCIQQLNICRCSKWQHQLCCVINLQQLTILNLFKVHI